LQDEKTDAKPVSGFKPRDKVRILKLTMDYKKELQVGDTGFVSNWDEESKRWGVKLDTGKEAGKVLLFLPCELELMQILDKLIVNFEIYNGESMNTNTDNIWAVPTTSIEPVTQGRTEDGNAIRRRLPELQPYHRRVPAFEQLLPECGEKDSRAPRYQ